MMNDANLLTTASHIYNPFCTGRGTNSSTGKDRATFYFILESRERTRAIYFYYFLHLCVLVEQWLMWWLGPNLNWQAVRVGIVSNLGRQSTKFCYKMLLWPYVWLYSVFKSCSHIFGYIDGFWSYVGYMVESGELVILWSYEIGGRGKWEFGQIVGYM